MIKSVISGLIAVSVLATPVVAEARGRGDHRVEQNHRGHRGVNTGEAIAIGLGAFILGAAISGGNREERYEERYEDREYERPRLRGRYERRCYEYREPVYDRYGRMIYNEVYTRCY